MTKIASIASAFVGFLTHYSGEVANVATALESVIGALPIDAADKQRVTDIIDALNNASANVANAVQELQGQTLDVVVSAEDVQAAVAAYLQAHPELFHAAGSGAPAPQEPAPASDQLTAEPMNSANG